MGRGMLGREVEHGVGRGGEVGIQVQAKTLRCAGRWVVGYRAAEGINRASSGVASRGADRSCRDNLFENCGDSFAGWPQLISVR